MISDSPRMHSCGFNGHAASADLVPLDQTLQRIYTHINAIRRKETFRIAPMQYWKCSNEMYVKSKVAWILVNGLDKVEVGPISSS